ncbi:MAG TPA: hypothetical protein DCY42_13605, partial [Chloroflexi bacterium]|nr:hypothetical protein [Chloroflexota bacterium]
MKTTAGLQRTQSAKYQIKIQGRQTEGWADWMDDLEIVTERKSEEITVTTLTGMVKDQSGLHGLLNRIRDLSIPLISVQY